jgi:hypothetical protein
VALSTLHHVFDLEWMREAYRLTRKDGAPGIDGVTAAEYAPSSTPRARTSFWSASIWWGIVVLGSASAAMRLAPGNSSIRRSWRLPSSSGARRLTPVVLPPGLASEATSPDLTNGEDRNRCRRLLRRSNGNVTSAQDDVDLEFGKLRSNARKLIER